MKLLYSLKNFHNILKGVAKSTPYVIYGQEERLGLNKNILISVGGHVKRHALLFIYSNTDMSSVDNKKSRKRAQKNT